MRAALRAAAPTAGKCQLLCACSSENTGCDRRWNAASYGSEDSLVSGGGRRTVHDLSSRVLVQFSKLSIQRDVVFKSCSLFFLVFTSLPQMTDPPLSLRYIHSTFSPTNKDKRTCDCATGTSKPSGC